MMVKNASTMESSLQGEEFTEFLTLRRPYMRFEFPMPRFS